VANRKVALIRYCMTEKGWRRDKAALHRDGQIHHGFVEIKNERKGPYLQDHYELRFLAGDKLRYKHVGNDPIAARLAWDIETKVRASTGPALPGGVARLTAIDRALTIEELACLLHVSPRIIDRETAERRLPCFRIGSAVRFWPAEIIKYLREGAREAR